MKAQEQLLADLDALDALFADESKWTKGHNAKDSSGTRCSSVDVSAICWCLYGGASRVTGYGAGEEATYERYFALAEAMEVTADEESLASWQDQPAVTFADIKSLIASTRTRVASHIPTE